jgi:Hemolysin coregulated protein Hcp (TssD)
MSFLATLTLDGVEYNVLQCGYSFSQATDGTGKPTAIPQGGNINLLVESTGETDVFDWMISPTQVKSGTIVFSKRNNEGKLKTLDFSEAYCVGFNEVFDHTGVHPMQLAFTISAKQIQLNASVFEKNWAE